MSRGPHHFPTFTSLYRSITDPDRRGLAARLCRIFLTERGLLRLALYLLLSLGLVHHIGLWLVAGPTGVPQYGPSANWTSYPTMAVIAQGDGWPWWPVYKVLGWTTPLLGALAPSPLLLTAICLVGLAASCDRGRRAPGQPPQPAGATVEPRRVAPPGAGHHGQRA